MEIDVRSFVHARIWVCVRMLRVSVCACTFAICEFIRVHLYVYVSVCICTRVCVRRQKENKIQ